MRLIIKRFALLCVAVLVCGRVLAQRYYEEEPRVFNGGLILGANFSQVDGDTYWGYHKVGLNAGGVVYVHFTRVFGASMELIYSQKGSRGEDVTGSPIYGTYVEKYFMNLNYAEVPVTFHAIVHRVDIEAGLSYAYLVKYSEWVDGEQPVVIDPAANRFNTTDLDYVFGVGRRLYRGLYANVRFEYSVVSMRPTDRVPVRYAYGDSGQFNNLFNVRLMYLF